MTNKEQMILDAKDEAARELNMPLVTNFEDVKAIYYEGGIGSDLFDTIIDRAMEIYAEKQRAHIYAALAKLERMACFDVPTDTVRAWFDLINDKPTKP